MPISFEQIDVLSSIEELDDTALDKLDFGVIGFSSDFIVCRYNAYESQLSGIKPDKAIGVSLFTELAQCMNNFMVAVRFEDAMSECSSLDTTIDYMFSWRMRPTKVQLRLLYSPDYSVRYVLVKHRQL
jgi:photoactive yellow protein